MAITLEVLISKYSSRHIRQATLLLGRAVLLCLLTLVCVNFSCKETPPEPPPPPPPYVSTVQLAIEDTGVTDVWLKLRFTDTTQPRNYQLRRDNAIVLSGTLTTPDTVLLDTAALPKRTYQYKAYRLNNTTLTDSSAALSVTTMDTTSHNFTFKIDTLGVTSSVLYDVAIINDTLAYAVGEMYLRNDTTGQLDPIPYNMAKWDGNRWHPMRIQFYTICGQSSRTPYPASSIFAFGATDVWITSRGGQMARWDGTTQTATICNSDPFVINKIWGENPNSVYAVGWGGNIVHYSNGTWRRVASGTTLDVNDVFGQRNPRTNQFEILAVAGQFSVNTERKILRLSPTQVTAVYDSGVRVTLEGIWFVPDRHYYVVGGGMFDKHSIATLGRWRAIHPNVTSVYTLCIRGAALNDAFVGGSFAELLHFNGFSWRSYRGQITNSNAEFYSVAVTGKKVFAVGWMNPRAIVVRGSRTR